MTTYEVAQAIRKLEATVTELRKLLDEIAGTNKEGNANPANRKLQRLRNFTKRVDNQRTTAYSLLVPANQAQQRWAGDAIVSLIHLKDEAKALIAAEQQIAKRREVE